MNKRDVNVGLDDFGLYVEVNDDELYDKLEDKLTEHYGFEPLGVTLTGNNLFFKNRIWIDKSIGLNKLKEIVNEITSNHA